jgi:hypothetical protein
MIRTEPRRRPPPAGFALGLLAGGLIMLALV